jgi:hypothetical protein
MPDSKKRLHPTLYQANLENTRLPPIRNNLQQLSIQLHKKDCEVRFLLYLARASSERNLTNGLITGSREVGTRASTSQVVKKADERRPIFCLTVAVNTYFARLS